MARLRRGRRAPGASWQRDLGGEELASQPPHAHTTASASRRSPASPTTTVAPSGVARPRTTRAPCARARRGERLGRALGAQHAGLGLVEQELEVLAAEAREQAPALLDSQPLDRDALGAHRLLRRRLPAVAAAGEPDEPALDQQVRARLGLELAPQRARAARRGGVAGVPAVAAAVQARLAARGGAAVAGLELVDERHAHALAREPPCERGAEVPAPTITTESIRRRTLPCRGCTPCSPPPRSCSATPRSTAR